MAEFTYETRRKMTERWREEIRKSARGLSATEESLLPAAYYYHVPTKASDWMKELLDMGTYPNLSQLYRAQLSGLVAACLPEGTEEEFYYALDQMNQFQMTAGWYRRSMRSSGYAPFVQASIQLLWAYSRLKFYGASLSAVLTGQVSEEIYDHARTEYWAYAGMLAAQIDLGTQDAIEAVKDILLGEGNTAMISYELIRGIVRSKSEELYELLGKFLLAARLQEGARQAVCETMDAGRTEAFLHLFRVIEDNNLVRYSSVKRAVSTWIGIFNEKSVDRITDKLMRLMGRCLREPDFLEEQLATEDAVAISCALWAKGFYAAEEAVKAVQKLIEEGSRHQIITASYFVRSIQDERLKTAASKGVIRRYPDDLEMVACYLPHLFNAYGILRDLLQDEKGQKVYYASRCDKAVKPRALAVERIFDSRDEAVEYYLCLRRVKDRMPKKGIVINPCIFPWHQVELSGGDVVLWMAVIAWALQEQEYLDEVISLIPQLNMNVRAFAVRIFLYRPERARQKETLFELLHNAEGETMSAAFSLVEDLKLMPEDYVQIEKNLKYKSGREKTLSLLRKQSADGQKASISRLLQIRSEECHMGALDMALQMKKEQPEEFADVVPMLSALTSPTGKEQVLLDELTGESSRAQDILNTPGYGLYTPGREWVIPQVELDTEKARSLFPKFAQETCVDLLRKLNALIEENREREYTNAWKEERILGTKLEVSRWAKKDETLESLDRYPFRELWEDFYRKEIRTPECLLVLFFYQKCRGQRSDYEKNESLYADLFGKKSAILNRAKPPFDELVQGLRYGEQANVVIEALFGQFVPQSLRVEWGIAGISRLLSLLNESNALYRTKYIRWNKEEEIVTRRALELPIIQQMYNWILGAGGDLWETAFVLRFKLQLLYEKLADKEIISKYYGYRSQKNYVVLRDFVRCWEKGIWDKEMVYQAVFHFLNMRALLDPASSVEKRGALSYREAGVGGVNSFFGEGRIKPVDGKYRYDAVTKEEHPAIVLAHEIYHEAVPVVLQVELKRGEQETPFSGWISSINVIYGIDYMVQILTALGKDTLQRGYSYGSSRTSRKGVLSHLLSVSHPKPEETAKDLKEALKGTDITKKRLAELAMYAPQWIPMLEEYWKLPGLHSGCYYFMAHTSEGMDEYTQSVVAKYTPLSPEELRDGAFDLHWFFEAYNKLGEKNFKLLYDAAKYSSGGTAHGRARKYADAALGNVEKEALKAEIHAKRNKDLLMSLGLLPLDKGKKKKEEDMLDRYQFIQQFKKESKSFGAQRRASEGRAVDLALRNLSVNAGYTDVTRLTLRMESRLVESLSESFEWKALEEIELKLSVDETGKSSLLCRKGEKLLKAIPAKYKKNEVVLQIQDQNKKLREQYRRTRQMMEQAMEDQTSFEAGELLMLMKNPVIRPIIAPLVMMAVSDRAKIGFLSEDGMTDWTGALMPVKAGENLLIAHPYDLYRDGHWQEYQRVLFEKQIKQPFKQVFRELYVKLAEEMEKDQSLMFAGNQIQPQKTVGALRGRRWVADYEDGLQKIYYRENIIARIYAMADWFSPSDIEAPTLEGVVFYDRKTFGVLKIKDIPDVIYSEVMRDVDLAVSVAHAGGVDPETSHSTIEMRRVIVECNLKLFKVKNVRIDGNHAVIDGKLGQYTVHLGSGVVHQMGNAMLFVIPVHSQHRGRMFLPFVDDDPKTAEIMSKILLFAEDTKIKDPGILAQIR